MHHDKQCGCEHHSHQGHGGMAHHHGSGGGCCCSGGYQGRHFYTEEEMLNHMQKYLEQLKAEVKGVEEHINKLKSGKK